MTTLAVGARSTLVAAEVSEGCGEKINEFETPIQVACRCYVYFSASSVVFLFLLPWGLFPSPLPTLSCRIHR